MKRIVLLLLFSGCLTAAQQPQAIDLKIDDAPLLKLLERIAKQCDAGLVVHKGLGDRLKKEVHLIAHDAKWEDAVRLFRSEYGIAVKLDRGFLEVEDVGEEFVGRVELRFYDVRSLTAENGHSSRSHIRLPGGSSSDALEKSESALSIDVAEVIEIIQSSIAPESWDSANVVIEEDADTLAIIHLPEVHDQVSSLLNKMQKAAARQVTCRVYRLEQAQIPAEGGVIIPALVWEKLEPTIGPVETAFALRDGQLSYVFSGLQTAYVSDSDIVQEQQDPIIDIMSNGFCVSVEAKITVGGVMTNTQVSNAPPENFSPVQLNDDSGKSITAVDVVNVKLDDTHDTRLVPFGAAALYRFGNHAYAITYQVLE